MDAKYLYRNSLATQTLRGNSDTPIRVDRPLITETGGNIYPQNPTNGYISRCSGNFTRCLGCSSLDHRFSSCLRYNEKIIKNLFWPELLAQVPSTRKKPSPPCASSNPLPPPPPLSSFLPLFFRHSLFYGTLDLLQVLTPTLLIGNNNTMLSANGGSLYLLAFSIFLFLSVN